MNKATERILLVESDPGISDLIARQTLAPQGYQVQIAVDASSAIQEVAAFAPDLVITNLSLPGLSGKDMLVALSSQGNNIPLIVVARKGDESDVIQAFRLGAADVLLWPARDAEIAATVERVVRQVRDRKASQKLDTKLKDTHTEMQQRVRELTTIVAVGRAVLSINDQRLLFDKIVEGMLYVAEADAGWLLLRDETTRAFLLAGQRNLPESWAQKMGSTLDDGISSLVALSGETLAVHGEALQRFKAAALGRSAIVVPVKVQNDVIGLVVIIRKADEPFQRNTQTLLEAITDYASISLVNARLYRALQETAEKARASEQQRVEQLEKMCRQMHDLLQPVTYPVDLLLSGKMGTLTAEQEKALKLIQTSIQRVEQLLRSAPDQLEMKGPRTEH